MQLNTFIRRFEKLKTNSPELIEEYDNKSAESLDDCMNDMLDLFNKYLKVQPQADPIGFIQNSLRSALSRNISILDAMEHYINTCKSSNEKTTLQQYFNEISQIYDKHDNNYDIEYCPDNRDKLIEMNLKTVISIAKGYQGLGLSLEELIGAGNLGLVVAFDKYDPQRAKLKEDMLGCIEVLPDDTTEQQIIQSIQQYLTYGDIKKKFIQSFGIFKKGHEDSAEPDKWKEFSKGDIIKWIKRNVKNATFNSVAFMWIKAYILIEIDNCSRLVKKPKTEIYNDKLKYGAYKKEITVDIDAPISDDGDTCIGDLLRMDDDEPTSMEVSEAYDTFKDGLNKLLDGVKPRDRAVFLKKFGIGLPRPMLPKEIADQENLSIARISQIFQSVIEQMQRNQAKYNINPNILFNAASKLN